MLGSSWLALILLSLQNGAFHTIPHKWELTFSFPQIVLEAVFREEMSMHKTIRTKLAASLIAAGCFGVSGVANALMITPDTDPANLLAALFAGGGSGIDVSSATATLNGHTLATGETSSGTYTNASGTYGIGSGVILSTGDVADYGDGASTGNTSTSFVVAATAAEEALLDPITGGGFDHNDVTTLVVGFDMLPGETDVFFNIVFGSEEFPDFVGSDFIDGFGLYLNGVNLAFVDSQPVNINHPDFDFETGTELNGVLGGSSNPLGSLVHTFNGAAMAMGNELTFVIADTSDDSLDSTVYISQLGGSAPPPPPPPNPIPAPATLALFGLGLAGLGWKKRKKA